MDNIISFIMIAAAAAWVLSGKFWSHVVAFSEILQHIGL